MNSSGEIVGFYNPTSGSTTPNLFVYSGGMNGSTSTVTTPGTNLSSITGASGINNSGVVVGDYQLGGNPNPTGFYYSGGTCNTISSMGCPEAINGNEVVGADNDGVAAIYTLGGQRDEHRHARRLPEHRLRRQQRRHGCRLQLRTSATRQPSSTTTAR